MKSSEEIVVKLKSLANPENVKGMARFGIASKNTLGVSMPEIRKLAKEVGRDQKLSLEIYQSGIHEAKILAGLIGVAAEVTESQMDLWVKDFDSWDVCDQVCMNLFDKTDFAKSKAIEWAKKEPEFVRRAGFALMASMAVHDKKMEDEAFEPFFSAICERVQDERNFVKKAVNWALRQIGKRNENLRIRALQVAAEILKINSKSAKWIAGDAMRELRQKSKVKK